MSEEYVLPESMALARASWDAATGEDGGYLRMAMLSRSQFLLAHCFSVTAYEVLPLRFDDLPAGLAYELGLMCQLSRAFMQGGLKARKLRAVA